MPRPDRDDYLDVLNKYGLEVTDDEFKVLSTTRGRQVTDNYEFVPAFNVHKIEFEIAGVKHRQQEKLKEYYEENILREGAKLELVRDEQNEYDPYAIMIQLPVKSEKLFLGYVPRYYSKELSDILDRGVDYSGIITKVDLDSAISDEKIAVKISLIFSDR